MIRIRYRDLAPGLHGKVERCARGVTVYLLPGLTGKQRKAVLRRLRQEASRGCGPGLPNLGTQILNPEVCALLNVAVKVGGLALPLTAPTCTVS